MTSRPDQTGVGTALAVSSVAPVQFGAALAATLFPLIGPVGTVSLRLIGSAAVLVALTRPWRVRWTTTGLRNAAAFGLVLVVMNASLYIAIDRPPLAAGITIEFLGPLGVAVATATSWRQLVGAAGRRLWRAARRFPACRRRRRRDRSADRRPGWASYILMSRRIGTSEHGLAGLCLANVLGAAIMAPLGVVAAGRSCRSVKRPDRQRRDGGVPVSSSASPASWPPAQG